MRRLVLALAPLFLLNCATRSDPNQGRYSCATDADCGQGYECHAQFAGGALCFKAGTCVADESCNGLDDTCDGRVDESFQGQGDACDTGSPGVCKAGERACAVGFVVCVQTKQPTAETCNGLDDDCNGAVDETFELATDPKNCGTCGHACAPGATCRASACAETDCQDGLDNDSNGEIDCRDSACLGAVCLTVGGSTLHCGLTQPLDGGAPCDPRTCQQQGQTCGFASDGCGGVLTCGPACDGGACTPKDCQALGLRCGLASDGCGGLLDCGPCDGGCTPVTCQAQGLRCGITGDGCGSILDCGPCDAGVVDGGLADGGALDAGAPDAGGSDAGAFFGSCFPPESRCGDGLDDDGDGLVDCADPDCAGKICAVAKTCSAGACQ